IFGDCVYGWQETMSLLFGYLSILCWLNAQMPQVIKNYKLRDAKGLSFTFLTIWLIGDVANFIGCIITGQLTFQIILSMYFTCIDTILCIQWLYYVKYANNCIRRWFDGDDEIKIMNTTVIKNKSSTVAAVNITMIVEDKKEMNEQASLLSSSSNNNNNQKKYLTMMMFAFGFYTTLGQPTTFSSSMITTTTTTTLSMMNEDNNKTIIWVGRLFAWICTFLYLSSRLPQIYRNFHRRSVQGLSIYLFLFAAMGNMTYVLSILINPHATRSTMLEAVPYLLGSAGTLLFDCTIFIQYAFYNKINRTHQEDNNRIQQEV
ncbi:PQ loop repeat-domain-containing protein, partial [Cokeromyces recurvatus]|uniref:PQ loop repeat-domain-containing protein n=1 Tax=Cokeromyces recurvatus TaxID=90255 RepID=UPI00221F806A